MGKWYEDLDSAFRSLSDFLNAYRKSETLQTYVKDEFYSFFYGNLILNVFNNLNRKNVKELGLPQG